MLKFKNERNSKRWWMLPRIHLENLMEILKSWVGLEFEREVGSHGLVATGLGIFETIAYESNFSEDLFGRKKGFLKVKIIFFLAFHYFGWWKSSIFWIEWFYPLSFWGKKNMSIYYRNQDSKSHKKQRTWLHVRGASLCLGISIYLNTKCQFMQCFTPHLRLVVLRFLFPF